MILSGKTDIGRGRAENQDTFRAGNVAGMGAYAIVCDGMGGAQNGRLASSLAATCLEEYISGQLFYKPDEPEQMLRGALELANAEVFAHSGSEAGMMGTTVVCAYIYKRVLHVIHVGDSRAYLYQNGRLHQLTRDHSMVQELVDMGTITEDQAVRHPEKNVITRALGVEAQVIPSYIQQPIDASSVVLLCSDGLSNMVSFSVIEEIINQLDVHELADEFISAALLAGGDDNITVQIMSPEESDW